MYVVLSLWLVKSLVPAPAAPAPAHQPIVTGRILTLDQPPTRVLRGDWEPVRWVAFVYSPTWSESLAAIAKGLPPTARPLVITPHPYDTADVEAWLTGVGVPARRASIVEAGVETPWIRDYGPFEVRDRRGQHIYIDAGYSARPGDDPLPGELSELFGVPMEALNEELDGGAMVANGTGLCVSTVEAFALHDLHIDDPEAMGDLQQQLGCEVLALVPALSEDETKHADMFLQFVSPTRAMLAQMELGTEDGERLEHTAELLAKAALRAGVPLEIIRIPMVLDAPGVYLTYVNGLQVGDRYLVPRFAVSPDGLEEEVWEALNEAMPGRQLIPVPADEMIVLNGAVHCVTLGLSSGAEPLRVAINRR